jgi:hypothetical protein
MEKILSFGVSEELFARLVAQQQRDNFVYLSPFLRSLVESQLSILEQSSVTEDTTNE